MSPNSQFPSLSRVASWVASDDLAALAQCPAPDPLPDNATPQARWERQSLCYAPATWLTREDETLRLAAERWLKAFGATPRDALSHLSRCFELTQPARKTVDGLCAYAWPWALTHSKPAQQTLAPAVRDILTWAERNARDQADNVDFVLRVLKLDPGRMLVLPALSDSVKPLPIVAFVAAHLQGDPTPWMNAMLAAYGLGLVRDEASRALRSRLRQGPMAINAYSQEVLDAGWLDDAALVSLWKSRVGTPSGSEPLATAWSSKGQTQSRLEAFAQAGVAEAAKRLSAVAA